MVVNSCLSHPNELDPLHNYFGTAYLVFQIYPEIIIRNLIALEDYSVITKYISDIR